MIARWCRAAGSITPFGSAERRVRENHDGQPESVYLTARYERR
jgi:hypothetical protein